MEISNIADLATGRQFDEGAMAFSTSIEEAAILVVTKSDNVLNPLYGRHGVAHGQYLHAILRHGPIATSQMNPLRQTAPHHRLEYPYIAICGLGRSE